MPSVYNLKPKFQNLPRPVTNGRARADITANQVRNAAMLLSLATDAALIGASRRYDGSIGKNDRALLFGALGLSLGLGVPIASAVVYMLWMVLALLCTPIANRSRSTLAELRSRSCS